jgi:hypothetical protein
MAQAGFTPISLYSTTTASAVPLAANLVSGELALNTTDGKMYFKNTGGVVTLLSSVLTAVANGGTGVTTSTGSGSNVLNTSPSLVTPVVDSLNGGQLAGMRNRIINGGMQVAQRANGAITNTLSFGSVDRMQAIIGGGGTGISGAISQSTSPAFNSGYFMAISGATWTSGNAQFSQKIESRNTQDLSGKTITVSCKVFQDTGATRTFQFVLFKPNSLDTFSAVTQIGANFGSTLVATGTTTPVSGSITLGASDAVNGLQIFLIDSAVNTVSNKNYYMGDFQLELGSVATPFEQRPIGLEFSLCQRYYEVGTSFGQNDYQSTNAATFGNGGQFSASKRVSPTMSISSTAGSAGTSGFAISARGSGSFSASAVGAASAGGITAQIYIIAFTASAEL